MKYVTLIFLYHNIIKEKHMDAFQSDVIEGSSTVWCREITSFSGWQ